MDPTIYVILALALIGLAIQTIINTEKIRKMEDYLGKLIRLLEEEIR